MIRLSSKKQELVGPVHVAGAGDLQQGTVYVFSTDPDGLLRPQLPEGKRAVLETESDDDHLELVTRNQAVPGIITAGTYVDQADYGQLVKRTKPTIRLYRPNDTWRKARSGAGRPLILTTVAGLVAAAAGLYFGVWGEGPSTGTTVADRAETTLQWVVQPVARLNTLPAATVRQEVDRRGVAASRCLVLLRGGEAPTPTVPGVACTTSSPPFWKNTDTATWITLVVGLITALVSTLQLRDRFGFQKTPTAS